MSHHGEIVLHRNMKGAPEPFLKAVTPYREGLVVAVECLFTWYGLADLCAEQGLPFVLGHALYMKAIHGGKAKHDQIDSQQMAALLRGGMLPQAYVYPAERRATRDRLRRRTHLMRKRAELLAHVQHTNSPYHLPDIGKKSAHRLWLPKTRPWSPPVAWAAPPPSLALTGASHTLSQPFESDGMRARHHF